MMGPLITVLRSLVTALNELAQQLQRNTNAMTTQTASLTDALALLKPAIQLVVSDEGAKTATILDLQTKLAASQQAEAEARANAATPEQIAELQADAVLLQSALHAVQNTPAPGGDASSTPAPVDTTTTPAPVDTTTTAAPVVQADPSAATTTTPETTAPGA